MARLNPLIEIARRLVGMVKLCFFQVCEAMDMLEYVMLRRQVLL